MADKKISELPAANALVGGELVEVVQDGVNRRTTAEAFSQGAWPVLIALNNAPADGVIAAGQVVLWFSAANGNAFLMAKGKTFDGTVVTGQYQMT